MSQPEFRPRVARRRSRLINQYAAGVRYQGAFGGAGRAGLWRLRGQWHCGLHRRSAQRRRPAGPSWASRHSLRSKYNGKYTGWSIGSGGVALTYAGFTVGGNVIGGAKNGYASPMPQGAVHQLGYIVGAKYVYGPWTVGIAAMEVLGSG